MKKYFALILTAVILLTCFTACKPKLENGTVISDAASRQYPAVTEADGGLVRDEAGNLIVLVTDKNGKNVKDENGNFVTNPVALENALVIGNRIECPDVAITIPKGWSNKLSFADLNISRDGTKDVIKISSSDEKSLEETIAEKSKGVQTVAASYPGAVTETKQITFGDNIQAQFTYVYVDDTGYRTEEGEVVGSYYGYIFFRHGYSVFTCLLSSDRNMTEQLDEIIDILGTVEFI